MRILLTLFLTAITTPATSTMFPLSRFLLGVIASVAIFAFWKLSQFVYHQLTSPLRHLRGPKSSSFIYGNIGDVRTTVSRPLTFPCDLIHGPP